MLAWLDKWRSRALPGSGNNESEAGYLLASGFALFALLSGFLFDSPREIWAGLGRILLSPSMLLSDYIAIGGPGAAFVNCGLMTALCLLIARKSGAALTGLSLAALFMVGGFSLFGKNPLNAAPILLGVFLFARLRRERFASHLLSAFFGTALGPLVSYLAFGLGWPLPLSLPLAALAGALTGLALPSLAARFHGFHEGYSLYNMGFACGVVGMAAMALLRAFGLGNEEVSSFPLQGLDTPLLIWVLSLIALIALAGWLLSPGLAEALAKLMRHPGRGSCGFAGQFGMGPVLFNMSLLGLIATLYVFLSGGRLSGPGLGAILSLIGFGAFGKHPGNSWPVLLGAFVMSHLGNWHAGSDSIVIAALFGTSLTPIPGVFGWPAGILAGVLHIAVSANLGYLHGYVNLYNNGFASVFVAAALSTLLTSLGRREDTPEQPQE